MKRDTRDTQHRVQSGVITLQDIQVMTEADICLVKTRDALLSKRWMDFKDSMEALDPIDRAIMKQIWKVCNELRVDTQGLV